MIWHYFFQLVASYCVGIACTLTIEGPRSLMFKVSIIDTAGWIIYLLCLDYLKLSVTLATYFSGLVIAAMSHWFAVKFHEPVTLFFIPGFFTLVPGGGMYRTAFYFFDGQTEAGLFELVTTLSIALAIALAVFTVDVAVAIMRGQSSLKYIRPSRVSVRRRRGVPPFSLQFGKGEPDDK